MRIGLPCGFCCWIVCASASAAALGGMTVQIQPVRDNTLYSFAEDPPPSNGAGIHLFTGKTAIGGTRRAVLAFDIAATIPPGSLITDVTLTMFMSRTNEATQRTVTLQRLTADWGEGASNAANEEGLGIDAEPGDATWDHTFFPTDFWTAPGGDYLPTVSASTAVGNDGIYYDWNSAQLIADVQNMVDNPSADYGWIVIGDESESQTAKRFDTREHPNATRRPVLEIQFEEGPPIPTLSQWGLAGLTAMLILAGAVVVSRRYATVRQ